MIWRHTGSHSINELLHLTAGLKYFRYFPPAGGLANDSDSLQCIVRLAPGATSDGILACILKLREKFENILLIATLLEEKKIIKVEVMHGNQLAELEIHHFEDCKKIEDKLLELCQSFKCQLELPVHLAEWGFDPEKYA